jgi:hypothetical protein
VPRLISSAVARLHGGIRGGVYLRCCSLPTMDQPLPLVPGVAPTPSWAIKVSGEMISSYRKPQRRLLSTKWDSRSHAGYRLLYPFGLLPRARWRGASGGCRRRGAGRAHSAGHAPLVASRNAARTLLTATPHPRVLRQKLRAIRMKLKVEVKTAKTRWIEKMVAGINRASQYRYRFNNTCCCAWSPLV